MEINQHTSKLSKEENSFQRIEMYKRIKKQQYINIYVLLFLCTSVRKRMYHHRSTIVRP